MYNSDYLNGREVGVYDRISESMSPKPLSDLNEEEASSNV